VDAILHGHKRSNIPTADAQDVAGDDVQVCSSCGGRRAADLHPGEDRTSGSLHGTTFVDPNVPNC
jgi:hypothetical protein